MNFFSSTISVKNAIHSDWNFPCWSYISHYISQVRPLTDTNNSSMWIQQSIWHILPASYVTKVWQMLLWWMRNSSSFHQCQRYCHNWLYQCVFSTRRIFIYLRAVHQIPLYEFIFLLVASESKKLTHLRILCIIYSFIYCITAVVQNINAVLGAAEVVDVLDELASLFLILTWCKVTIYSSLLPKWFWRWWRYKLPTYSRKFPKKAHSKEVQWAFDPCQIFCGKNPI